MLGGEEAHPIAVSREGTGGGGGRLAKHRMAGKLEGP